MTKRALLVGIDDYHSEPLIGCVADAIRLGKVLERNENGERNFSCMHLLSSEKRLTKSLVRRHMEELFDGGADVSLFYFAGHGIVNRLGGHLVTQDTKEYDEGISIQSVIDLANAASSREVIIILDCCHSGAVGKPRPLHPEHVELRLGISILTSTSPSQRSVERDEGGLFTSLVCDALEGGAADIDGVVTIAATYAYVDRALGTWDQRPLLLSHVSRLIPLRRCSASVEPSILRLLPEYFPSPHVELPLDPSFEPGEEPHNEANERIFANLQKLRAGRLLEPVGEEHMYFAALHSKSCRLTPLGKHYWRLAKANQL